MALSVSVQSSSARVNLQRELAAVTTKNAPAKLAAVKSFVSSPLPCGLVASHNRSRTSPAAASRCSLVTAAVAVSPSELDVVSKHSEIVPDTIVGDDFERFKPTAATVSSSLIIGMSCLPEAKFDGAIKNALAYGKCFLEGDNKMSCFFDKALVNVGKELTKDVSGRVSTEVDPRTAHNTSAIVKKVHELLSMYLEVEVPQSRVLFKIPATWEGIEAAKQLEAEGIQTHVTGVNSFAQAAACAQANVSVVQVAVGRVRDWARTHSGDKDIDAAVQKGEDPGVSMVKRACHFISSNGFPTKVMASNIRSKQDAIDLVGVDYLIVPLKVLEALKQTPAGADMRSSLRAGDGPTDQVKPWDADRFSAEVGPCAQQLLAAEIESAVDQADKVEKHFAKIWPPPNV